MTHLDDTTIELYVLNADQVKKQRKQIESHLEKCEGCREVHTRIASFYADVKEDMAAAENLPVLRREELPERIEQFLKRRYYDRGPLRPIDVTLPFRIARWVVKHPYVSGAGGLGFAGLALALLLFALKPEIKDRNPAYARAKEEFLVVSNKNGEELWRKHVGPYYDIEKDRSYVHDNPERALTTLDVNSDGKNEVIAIFGWGQSIQGGWPSKNAVVCYSADGSDRWRYEFHRQMKFGKDSFSDDYRFFLMAVGDYDHDGKMEVIAEAGHALWYPNAVVKLDAATGSLLGEYWHAGSLERFAHKDIDDDGIEELLFAGENNRFGRAAVVVLDPRFMTGYAPVPTEFTPPGLQAAREKYYAILPLSDFLTVAKHMIGWAYALRLRSDGLIEVEAEGKGYPYPDPLFYYFNSSFNCVKVKPSDTFTTVHKKLEAEGKLTKKLDEQYFEELRRGVQYWDGEKFVNHVTMNKRYLEATRMLP